MSYICLISCFYQSSFNSPEWFYRHVDMHAHCTELQPLPDGQQALFCSWSGGQNYNHVVSCRLKALRSYASKKVIVCLFFS